MSGKPVGWMRGSLLDGSSSAVMKMRRQPAGIVKPPNVNGSAEAGAGMALLLMMFVLVLLISVKVSVGLRKGDGAEDGVAVAPVERDADGGGEAGGMGGRGEGGRADDVAPGQPLFFRRGFFSIGIRNAPNGNPAQGFRHGQR